MVKLLPFILVPVVLLAGLGYWRYTAARQALTTPQVAQQETVLNEVPKTLPALTIEDRVKTLEAAVVKFSPTSNSLKSPSPQAGVSGSLDLRVNILETAIVDLKTRVSALEKTSQAPASSANTPVYIPLGSTSGPWTSVDWVTLSEYEIVLDPNNYPGYSGMNLEVNIRLNDPSGTGSVRLYNVTDSTAITAQADTTITTFSLKSSASFKLPAGKKTYKLQVKSSGSKELYIQSARIKVNF